MTHVCTETTTYDTVPGREKHGVELIFNYLCYIIKNSSLLESECHAVDCLLLHVLVHVSKLYHRVLSVLLVNSSM